MNFILPEKKTVTIAMSVFEREFNVSAFQNFRLLKLQLHY